MPDDFLDRLGPSYDGLILWGGQTCVEHLKRGTFLRTAFMADRRKYMYSGYN